MRGLYAKFNDHAGGGRIASIRRYGEWALTIDTKVTGRAGASRKQKRGAASAPPPLVRALSPRSGGLAGRLCGLLLFEIRAGLLIDRAHG